jgi:PKHD-type hydroxylase
MCIAANKEWFNFNITNVSYVQLAEYDSAYEGEYKKHHDVFWINNEQYHRKLTCVIQLTDPSEYEGGDLELFDLTEYPNAEQVRSQGTAIFFPSFVPHRAHPVTKGKRYSLAVWFQGPKWV